MQEIKLTHLIRFIILSFLTFGCIITKDVKESFSTDTSFQSGDILVTDITSDSVYHFDSNGTLKGAIYDTVSTTNNLYGLGWNSDTDELLITRDGNNDGIFAMSMFDGSTRNYIANTYLSGTIRSVAQLAGGDIVVIESNNLERFTSAGVRVTNVNGSAWPKTNIQATPEMVYPKSDGGFILCSRGTDVVRTYDSDGTQQNSTGSGIAGTSNAYGCIELSDGQIAVSWQGTTDTISIYSSDLSTLNASYSNTSILGNPRGLAQAANGNILILDISADHIVEIDTNGNYVKTLTSGSGLSGPQQILVVP